MKKLSLKIALPFAGALLGMCAVGCAPVISAVSSQGNSSLEEALSGEQAKFLYHQMNANHSTAKHAADYSSITTASAQADGTVGNWYYLGSVSTTINGAYDCDHQDDGYLYADTNHDEKWDEGDKNYSSGTHWYTDGYDVDVLPRQTPYFGYMLNELLDSYPDGNPVIANNRMQGICMMIGTIKPHYEPTLGNETAEVKLTYDAFIDEGLSSYACFNAADDGYVDATHISGASWVSDTDYPLPACDFIQAMAPQTMAAFDTMVATTKDKAIHMVFKATLFGESTSVATSSIPDTSASSSSAQ